MLWPAMPSSVPHPDHPTPAVSGAPAGWMLTVLCAEWCGTCRSYRATLDGLRTRLACDRVAWLDIEDDSDWMGDLEVQNFPTLLITHNGVPHFFGTVLPHPESLLRLVASTREGARPLADADADLQQLSQRLADWAGRSPA